MSEQQNTQPANPTPAPSAPKYSPHVLALIERAKAAKAAKEAAAQTTAAPAPSVPVPILPVPKKTVFSLGHNYNNAVVKSSTVAPKPPHPISQTGVTKPNLTPNTPANKVNFGKVRPQQVNIVRPKKNVRPQANVQINNAAPKKVNVRPQTNVQVNIEPVNDAPKNPVTRFPVDSSSVSPFGRVAHGHSSQR